MNRTKRMEEKSVFLESDDAPKPIQPKYATIPDWCTISGMSRSSTYLALSRDDIRAIKVGKRVLIDVDHGLKWMAALPAPVISIKKPDGSNLQARLAALEAWARENNQ